MNSTAPRTRSEDPLRHLRAPATVGVPATPARSVSSSQRLHRNLVRLGRALIAVAPVLALSHLVIDLPGAGVEFTWWTLTIASYDAVAITVIIGIALAFRTAPTVVDAVVIRKHPPS